MKSKSIPPIFEDITLNNSYQSPVGSNAELAKLQQLTYGLSRGDSEALEALYLHLGDSVMFFLKKILRSDDDAFDVTQEVFINLWQNRHRINPKKSIKGYIFKIAKTSAIDFINDKKKRDHTNTVSFCDTVTLDFAPDELIMAEEVKILIGLALETMPNQRRKVFEMSRIEGLGYDDIASEMNISKRTVENHIYNVMKELKELLACVIFFMTL